MVSPFAYLKWLDQKCNSYELKTVFYKNDYFWDYSSGGVMFRVKF